MVRDFAICLFFKKKFKKKEEEEEKMRDNKDKLKF